MTRGTAYQLRDLDGELQESNVLEQMKVLDRGDQGNGVYNRRPGWRTEEEQSITTNEGLG